MTTKELKVRCEKNAFWCLGPENNFRKSVFKAVQTSTFQNGIITAILISTLSLCAYDPRNDPNEDTI